MVFTHFRNPKSVVRMWALSTSSHKPTRPPSPRWRTFEVRASFRVLWWPRRHPPQQYILHIYLKRIMADDNWWGYDRRWHGIGGWSANFYVLFATFLVLRSLRVSCILLSWHKYISYILDWGGISNFTTVDTPLQRNVKFLPTDGELRYFQSQPITHTWSVNLFACAFRGHLSYDVGIVSQFVDSPRTDHNVALFHMLASLHGVVTCSLFFLATSPL